MHNVTNKEEFKGDTSLRTAAYTLVREDSSTGSTYKLSLEASYAESLFFRAVLINSSIEISGFWVMMP